MIFDITFVIYLALIGAIAWDDLRYAKDTFTFKA